MKLKFKVKILILFVILVVVSSALNMSIASYSIQKNLTNDLVNRIVAGTKGQITSLTSSVLTNDTNAIISLIFNEKNANKEIAYEMVLDAKGKPLATTLIDRDPDFLIGKNSLRAGEDHQVQLISAYGSSVYDIALRLDYDQGILRVGYYTDQIDASVKSILLLLLFGSILAIVVAIISGYIFARSLFRPLEELTKVVQKVSDGDLSAKAVVSADDEMGFLATSFNEMTSKILVSQNELKAKAEELSEGKARLISSINSLSFGVAIFDEGGKVLLKNPAFETILNLHQQANSIQEIAEGMRVVDTNINVKDLTDSGMRTMVKGEQLEFREVSYEKLTLRLIFTPILEKNVAIGYIFLVEDISEAKILERSREEFFVIASHELRTPLTAIRGNMEMLKDYGNSITEDEKTSMISDALSGSVRLIQIVNDFLDASRLEQGKISFNTSEFDVIPVIIDSIRELEQVAQAKKLSLTFEKSPISDTTISADPVRVKQVIVNLIGNAINYSEQGGVTVSLKQAKDKLSIIVADTGKGIHPKNQALLFRKFQQAGSDMLARDATKSSGLGLYISRLIVEAMGGTIELVSSIPGKGSTFCFTVPMKNILEKEPSA